MKNLLILLSIFWTLAVNAQELEKAAFQEDIKTLYHTGMKTLKPLIEGDAVESMGDEKTFKTSLTINGAKDAFIKVDAEGSHTYVAQYAFKNVRDPKAKLEEMANWILEATEEYGLEKSVRTDITFVNYQKHTIEFPADNIDDMGKHTSFAIGLTKDGNPMALEIMVSEILWK
ncbi:MAG: hypothetical protein Salg2KO_14610 [Salibacteraceae bacterium]